MLLVNRWLRVLPHSCLWLFWRGHWQWLSFGWWGVSDPYFMCFVANSRSEILRERRKHWKWKITCWLRDVKSHIRDFKVSLLNFYNIVWLKLTWEIEVEIVFNIMGISYSNIMEDQVILFIERRVDVVHSQYWLNKCCYWDYWCSVIIICYECCKQQDHCIDGSGMLTC